MQRDKIPTTKKKDKLIGHTNFVQHYNLKHGNLSTLVTSRLRERKARETLSKKREKATRRIKVE